MKLTPLDIQQQKFRTGLTGFDKTEVDAFLDIIASDVETMIRENNALKDELRRKESDIVEFKERERTLKDTMLTATQMAEDIKQNARKEAEIVIAQAQAQAEQIIQNAHTRLVRVMEDLDELRRQKAQFEAALRSVISTHTKLLDAMEEKGTDLKSNLALLRQRRGREGLGESTVEEGRVLQMGDKTVRVDDDLLTPRGGDR